jgi:hypothetical protein
MVSGVAFFLARQAESALTPSVLDRGADEKIELISTSHFDKLRLLSSKV